MAKTADELIDEFIEKAQTEGFTNFAVGLAKTHSKGKDYKDGEIQVKTKGQEVITEALIGTMVKDMQLRNGGDFEKRMNKIAKQTIESNKLFTQKYEKNPKKEGKHITIIVNESKD